jgi:hypothetical protein
LPLSIEKKERKKEGKILKENWFGSNWWGVPIHQLSFSSKEKP